MENLPPSHLNQSENQPDSTADRELKEAEKEEAEKQKTILLSFKKWINQVDAFLAGVIPKEETVRGKIFSLRENAAKIRAFISELEKIIDGDSKPPYDKDGLYKIETEYQLPGSSKTKKIITPGLGKLKTDSGDSEKTAAGRLSRTKRTMAHLINNIAGTIKSYLSLRSFSSHLSSDEQNKMKEIIQNYPDDSDLHNW